MVNREEIQAICDDIVREFAPLQIILFGSYAYGTPTEHSDVDLLVVMPGPKSETRRQEIAIRKHIPYQLRIDLLVRSPEEIAYRLSYNDWFLREITEKGEVLYEVPNFFSTTPQKGKMRNESVDVGMGRNCRRRLYGNTAASKRGASPL